MGNNTELIINKLGLKNVNLKDLILNKISIPIVDDYNSTKDYWYPHPPCLIPLFLGYGASYKGIVHHFFCDRKSTFVEYYLEHGYISEIARNTEQFFTLLLLKMIIVKDEITDEIINFAEEIGYDKLNEIDEFAIEYGDDPKDFDKLIFFTNNLPFKNIKDINKYDGDFSSSLTIFNKAQLQNSSSFEISDRKLLKPIKDVPEWLSLDVNNKELFHQSIKENNLKKAWFTLNNKGWLLKDVANSLEVLKSIIKDELFHLMADNWINGWQNSNAKEGDSY